MPQRLPPTQPTQPPWGHWYVAGYEIDGRERLTYQLLTHTPITKPWVHRTHSGLGAPATINWPLRFDAKESHVTESPATGERHRPSKIYRGAEAYTPAHVH